MSRISDKELIDELQRLANELGKTPTREEMNDVGKFSRGPYDRAFGSWNAALEAAGFTPNHRTDISEEELIDELQRLAAELDRTPKGEEMIEYGKFTTGPFNRVFGSWAKALEVAGFEPNRYDKRPDSELVNDLQRVSDELGKPPTKAEFQEHGKCSPGVYERRFGSWNDALRKAGLELNCWIDIPEEVLIKELQRLADELGRPPVYEELEDYCEFSGGTYENRFGSWSEAVEAAGFEATILPINEQSDDEQRIIPDDVLLNELRELYTEIGRVPRQRDMIEFGRFGVSVYHSRFGSWNTALEAVELEPNKVHQISEDDLIADLHRLADELGRTPREQDVLEDGKYSFYTYQDRFDIWNDALRAAGFEPTKLEGEGSVQSLYLAIRRSLPGEWNAVRKEVYVAGSEDCAMESCDSDSETSLHAHHIVPVLAGGTNNPEMSIALCGTCHRKVEAYTREICDRVIDKIAREEGEWELLEAEREAKPKAGDQVSLTLFAENDQSTSGV